MADPASSMEDLEDGEIESDGEEVTAPQTEEKQKDEAQDEGAPQEKNQIIQEYYYTKSGKKKKVKSRKGEQKHKDKSKKNRKYIAQSEDDFASNVEKAIRKAMNRNDGSCEPQFEHDEDRWKPKKRKKYDGKDGPSKKRKKEEYSDEMDESEMMCVRGASPVQRKSPVDVYQEDGHDSYASDSSHDSPDLQHLRPKRNRPPQRDRNKGNKNDRRRGGAHPMQDPDGVCLYYMQGKCHKGDDCIYSHDAQPPRKMELCKFYLMDCCAKRDKCLYMHADFPCKYYHTGLPCLYKDECKFAHGKPLTENIKNILLKHIESAPKEILGDFPRLNRDGALKMIQSTQAKLMQLYPENGNNQERAIPSLFELNIPNPQNMMDQIQNNQFVADRQPKVSPKIRQSRWQNDNPNHHMNPNSSPNNASGTTNILHIKNLTGVLTPRQISDLSKMGIENLDQLGQLTVLQLNSIGISLKQITDIQLNTMSIQKLGLINSNSTELQSQQFMSPSAANKDLDLRVPPGAPVSNNGPASTELPGQDIDMRFQSSLATSVADEKNKIIKKGGQPSKDLIDIDQYTKDALKFVSKDKENIDISNEAYDSDHLIIASESKDVDHRVLPYADNEQTLVQHSIVNDLMPKEGDTDIRFLQPEPLFKGPEKRHRRSTTDDEDNNLLIDEKWYSSDEEKGVRRKSPITSPKPTSLMSPPQVLAPHVIEPSSLLSKLGDLSKIDISEEVTKLLHTMKNNLPESKVETSSVTESPKLRDPRSRLSPEKVSEPKKPAKKPHRVSIYECIDGEPTDGRRRTDVDLRQTDYKLPGFGDTDLRQNTSGDIDFRLGLPFKAIPNYTPASEINASINNHPPIPFKLVPIDIPRPDYTDIRNSTAKSQALTDPRLRKVFRLSLDESNSDNEKPAKPAPIGPRVDPRRKPKESSDILDLKSNSLDIQTVLQNSSWYKDLSSTQKIFVNQHLATITQMLKQFHQDKTPGKKFDLLPNIQNNSVFCNIFTNLGITLGENGEFSYLPKPKEALLKTPVNFNQPFGNMPPGAMDSNNMMNMPPMGMGGGMNNVAQHMHGYNQSVQDPRGGPTPGLLGIAPNIPHNFNNSNFAGHNNFGNMPFNGPGPGNDFNNYMDGEQHYQRFPNRGGHRGRGNDRWNRGGSNRGRKHYNDRGSWKNDRH